MVDSSGADMRLRAGILIIVVLASGGATAQDAFRRGDANLDGLIDIADAASIARIALDGVILAHPCGDAADVDDDGLVLIDDSVSLVRFLLLGFSPPAPPFPACGDDPTGDTLTDCTHDPALCEEGAPRQIDSQSRLSILGLPEFVEADPGEEIAVEGLRVVLRVHDLDEPEDLSVSAWSFGVAANGCRITQASTQGTVGASAETDPAGLRESGFERTELLEDGSGVVSAVILSFSLPIALAESESPEDEGHTLLLFSVAATAATESPTLRFVDDLRGSGEPVTTVINTPAGALRPSHEIATLRIETPRLEARFDAPERVLLLEDALEIRLPASSPDEGLDAGPILFDWAILDAPAGAASELLHRRARTTRLRVNEPGAHLVQLMIRGGAGFARVSTSAATITVVRPVDIELSPPRFALVPLDLTALTGRVLQFQLVLESGNPAPSFRVTGGPPGVEVDAAGRVTWTPSAVDVGIAEIQIACENSSGEARTTVEIAIVDSAEAIAEYRLDDDAGGDGGIASTRDAPASVPDGSSFEPASRLHLEFAPLSDETAVRRVDPDPPGGEDRFAGLRFEPQRGAGDAFGAVYRSGASASKLVESMEAGSEEFSIELWISRIAPLQDGAAEDAPAILAGLLPREGGSPSWSLGLSRESAVEFELAVRDADAILTTTLRDPSPLLDDELHHLVVTLGDGELRLQVDGRETVSLLEPRPPAWSVDHEITIGNDTTLTRPVRADIHLLAVHAEALSPGHVRQLHEMGLETPPRPSGPSVAICPDPNIIGQGILEIVAEVAPFAGDSGDGAVAGQPGCHDHDVRRASWHWSAPPERDDLRMEVVSSPIPCQRRVRIHFDENRAAEPIDLRLKVHQVPVRGVTRSAESSLRVSLPGARSAFRRGDANASGRVDVSDPVYILSSLFLRDLRPVCLDAVDANDDDRIDVSDAVSILGHLFESHPPPPAPGPRVCGLDQGAGTLGCRVYPAVDAPDAGCGR